jgi:hypothetical protein
MSQVCWEHTCFAQMESSRVYHFRITEVKTITNGRLFVLYSISNMFYGFESLVAVSEYPKF